MCGIIGYIGNQQALPILIEGLKRLEYRGYDSAGLVVANGHGLQVRKSVGCIAVLEDKVLAERDSLLLHGSLGVAHTRWATHGVPSEANAHPHLDMQQRVAVVHNGIIENHSALRESLERTGVVFRSQTDTEVLGHLISYHMTGKGNDAYPVRTVSTPGGIEVIDATPKEDAPTPRQSLLKAVLAALSEVVGTFGIVVVSLDAPGCIVAARRGSPLLVGVGNDEYIVASDASAIIAHTPNVIYLEDNEAVEISPTGLRIVTLNSVPVTRSVEKLAAGLSEIELGAYSHRMAKEIYEQPASLTSCLQGRLDLIGRRVNLEDLDRVARDVGRTRQFILTGCGTAWHAALIGEYLMEDLAGIHTEVEVASELRYRNPIIDEQTTVVAVSQSGETADTLGALREVRDKGALTLGVVNVVGSSVVRTTDAGIYLRVGPEIGVASTKAFTAQVAVLTMFALWMGRRRHLPAERYEKLIEELSLIPARIREVLEQSAKIAELAKSYYQRENWLFVGRGYHLPVALEGALKLKEVSYIHAEGLSAAEMKHGHIALISEGTPVVALAPQGSQYEKMLSNIEELNARGARVIAVGTAGDQRLAKLAAAMIEIPSVPEPLQPLLAVIPLQLLAYHIAVLRGCNVDRPRNLAKSVTVE